MASSWKHACAIAAILSCVATGPAFAVCSATCAITEITKLDFSTLQKPAAGSVTYTVPPDGSAASGSATVLFGTAVRGQYWAKVTGATTGCTGTTFDMQNVSTGNAGVTLGTLQGYGGTFSNTIQSLPFTSSGVYPVSTGSGTRFYIGATATIAVAATTGSFTPSYDLVCTIQ